MPTSPRAIASSSAAVIRSSVTGCAVVIPLRPSVVTRRRPVVDRGGVALAVLNSLAVQVSGASLCGPPGSQSPERPAQPARAEVLLRFGGAAALIAAVEPAGVPAPRETPERVQAHHVAPGVPRPLEPGGDA